MSVFRLPCPRVTLAILHPDQAELVRDYYLLNREHLAPWEPIREPAFYDIDVIKPRLITAAADFQQGRGYPFAILDNSSGTMIGICHFSNVVRGIFQACHLGFAIAESSQGKGIAFEAVQAGINYMFDEIGLHRIMANHMPHNERSARLLARLGFEREGYAKSYLKIAGQWQDHVLTALINPKER